MGSINNHTTYFRLRPSLQDSTCQTGQQLPDLVRGFETYVNIRHTLQISAGEIDQATQIVPYHGTMRLEIVLPG